MKPLKNTRHERVVQNIFNGMVDYEAYIKAGYSENGARASVSALLTKPNVQARLAYLKTQVAKRGIGRKEQKLLVLEQIFNHSPLPDQITARDRVLAISEHNKMAGDYAPEKHAILGDILIEVVYATKES